jgi:hypothetical protein
LPRRAAAVVAPDAGFPAAGFVDAAVVAPEDGFPAAGFRDAAVVAGDFRAAVAVTRFFAAAFFLAGVVVGSPAHARAAMAKTAAQVRIVRMFV